MSSVNELLVFNRTTSVRVKIFSFKLELYALADEGKK